MQLSPSDGYSNQEKSEMAGSWLHLQLSYGAYRYESMIFLCTLGYAVNYFLDHSSRKAATIFSGVNFLEHSCFLERDKAFIASCVYEEPAFQQAFSCAAAYPQRADS
jgi:hypothetical protein